MKIFLIILFFILTFIACKENAPYITEDNNNIETHTQTDCDTIPNVIKDIPVGLYVSHSPDSIYAQIYEKDTSKFIWKHSTTITSNIQGINIIEFGTYNYKNGKWVLGNLTKKPYSTEDFENWYFIKTNNDMFSWENCKNGILELNTEYIDPSSWSVKNSELVNRNGLWYYIGIDTNGKKYMGYGRYVTIPELMH